MKHRLIYTSQSYIVHRDNQAGRVAYSREDEEAPRHIRVSLQFLQSANTDLLRISGNDLSILNDHYRIVGLSESGDALECDLVEYPKEGT